MEEVRCSDARLLPKALLQSTRSCSCNMLIGQWHEPASPSRSLGMPPGYRGQLITKVGVEVLGARLMPPSYTPQTMLG
jgi:hypothetical protein